MPTAVLYAAVELFKSVKYGNGKTINEEVKVRPKRYAPENIRKFQDIKHNNYNDENNNYFTWEDVIEREGGVETICYLSGEKINLLENQYQLDHIIPKSREGKNTLDNLGIAHTIVNKMKHNLTPEELILWCKKILNHNGYDIIEK